MATAKKAAAPAKAVKQKAVAAVKVQEVKVAQKEKPGGEVLVLENIATLSRVVDSLVETLNMLVQKSESMAHHIVATEEVLAEVVAETGINLARVNARIRTKMAAGTDNIGDPSRAIDVAAAIASPRARR
ncbi:MAG TPA: hypothetical protein HPP76_02565 [Desulfuromonadales bacterium]|nr:hypothetical protein [Desulfuromonadales bacterium]